jgi:7,8-dihydropterin-6-yl-methyl-4-(beta-D-ribofuranosyl)aminobenzene 5'-phosphate synthase
MKLTILVDNNTLINNYLLGEPAFSVYIEEAGKKILYDTGYTDIFIRNAQMMNIDLLDLDYIILSHGHRDHTSGLKPLMDLYKKSVGNTIKKPLLVCHPLAFHPKIKEETIRIGSPIDTNQLKLYFDLKFTENPFDITGKLIFLGEIERVNDFENKKPFGKIMVGKSFKDDFLLDDTALVYKSEKGLVIISGCSHSGICNVIQYAVKVSKENKITDIIGGFHLLNPAAQELQNTLNLIKKARVKKIHPCHCTDLKSKIALSTVCSVIETGVGLELNYN